MTSDTQGHGGTQTTLWLRCSPVESGCCHLPALHHNQLLRARASLLPYCPSTLGWQLSPSEHRIPGSSPTRPGPWAPADCGQCSLRALTSLLQPFGAFLKAPTFPCPPSQTLSSPLAISCHLPFLQASIRASKGTLPPAPLRGTHPCLRPS